MLNRYTLSLNASFPKLLNLQSNNVTKEEFFSFLLVPPEQEFY